MGFGSPTHASSLRVGVIDSKYGTLIWALVGLGGVGSVGPDSEMVCNGYVVVPDYH